MTLLGAYVGNSAANIPPFEQWLGRETDVALTHVSSASWSAFEGSTAYFSRDIWSQIDKPVVWSLPLNVVGTTLEEGATGAFNSHFRVAAEWIERYAQNEMIYVRPGWEFNGDWMPWSAGGHEQAYVETFRQLVDTFRSVSDRFVFEWTVNVGDFGMNPADAYPGGAWVDIVGMDFYHNPEWDPADPLYAWYQMANRPYGLQWLEDFAAANGKPTAYSEWAVMTNNMRPYLELVGAWFEDHDVVYHNYWDSYAGGLIGTLSDGNNPDSGRAFRNVFLEVPQITVPEASSAPTVFATGGTVAGVWAGTDGNDHYSPGGSGVTMLGGFGDDTYVVASTADRVIEWSAGGVDTVFTNLAAYTLPNFVENLTFTGTSASSGTGNGIANLIIGNADANLLVAGGGDDVVQGGAGDDQLIGDSGNDVLSGGDGRDFVNGGNGNDVIEGGAGNDELWGLPGNDVIRGGDGVDRLFGNAGNDTLAGGPGDDWLSGGLGNDVVDGGPGVDTMAFDGNRGAFRIQASSQADQWLVTDIASGHMDVVTNVEFLAFLDTTIRTDWLI